MFHGIEPTIMNGDTQTRVHNNGISTGYHWRFNHVCIYIYIYIHYIWIYMYVTSFNQVQDHLSRPHFFHEPRRHPRQKPKSRWREIAVNRYMWATEHFYTGDWCWIIVYQNLTWIVYTIVAESRFNKQSYISCALQPS